MKKIFLSILTLVVLIVFGGMVFVVIARPAGLAQSTEGPVVSVDHSAALQPAQAPPFIFDPEAVSYEISEPDYGWLDISTGSDEQIIPADFEDDLGSAAIDMGFYFPFFGQIYGQVRLSDNGYLYFDGDETTGGNTPQTVPSEVDLVHNLIASFGANLFRNPGDSAVYIARQTEPERRLVVQFENAYWCCNLETPNDFQVVLYPDGRILSQYQSIKNDNPPHAYLTVGIENEGGTRGHHVYTGFLDETDTLHDQLAILYDPGETILGRLLFIPEAGVVQTEPGQTVTFTADLLNLSGVDSHFTITRTMQVNGADVPLLPVNSADAEEKTDESRAGDDSGGTGGTGEAEATDEPAQPTWSINILAEPGQVNNTYANPLEVEIFIPETATVGDVAVITFRALPEAVAGLEAVATLTLEVTSGE